jgi:hypothetical protein
MTQPELPNRTRWAREGHCSSARRRALRLSRQRWLSGPGLPLPLGRACDEAAARSAWAGAWAGAWGGGGGFSRAGARASAARVTRRPAPPLAAVRAAAP